MLIAIFLGLVVFIAPGRAHTVLPDGAAATVQECMDRLNTLGMRYEATVQTLSRSELEAVAVWTMARFRGLMAAFRNNAIKPDWFDDENTGFMVVVHARHCLCDLFQKCEPADDEGAKSFWGK